MTEADAAIEVLVASRTSEIDQFAILRVTLPPATSIPRHSHGESEALFIPLDGELLIVSGYGGVERVTPGTLVTVSAHERVSVENPTALPASMLVCLAPPTFAETLAVEPTTATRGASC
jgi:quercetin dioxygenase-like cupin family protein